MNANSDKVMINRGIELEYNALRSEILKRIELRQQIIAITLTLAGIFLSLGLTSELITLIYPPLAAFLALAWVQNDSRIRHIATYLREKIETLTTDLGYETYVQQARTERKKLGARRFVVMSHNGIFLFTQLMSIGIELSKASPTTFTPLKWGLLSIDILAIIIVVWVVTQARR